MHDNDENRAQPTNAAPAEEPSLSLPQFADALRTENTEAALRAVAQRMLSKTEDRLSIAAARTTSSIAAALEQLRTSDIVESVSTTLRRITAEGLAVQWGRFDKPSDQFLAAIEPLFLPLPNRGTR